ncbi:glutathione synthase, partial [Okeania sp. SIO2G5]|uniref:glutathione synthase n=1 Tax=Okeania sp. SIO2G5 TaxID=2607796 RepID=UPI0013C06F61
MNIAFIIDPIRQLDPGHDTSVALMEAAQTLGHNVWITNANQLSVSNGSAWATLQPVTLMPVTLVNGKWTAPPSWYELGDPVLRPLEDMDAVLMRSDPPVDTAYLYATYILDYVNPQKTLVLNRPDGLRRANEKMYALQFAAAIPETIVSQDKTIIRKFVDDHGAAVFKPLGGKGGEGIFFVEASDRNFNSLVEVSTQYSTLPIMVQQYLPAASDGDKRIILLDGEPIGAVNRVPAQGEFRGNMAAGGSVEKIDITDREREICAMVSPVVKQDGLIFVGLDVIGGYLTEINVTSPTGIREIDRLN